MEMLRKGSGAGMRCMNFFTKSVLAGLFTLVLSLFMVGGAFNPQQAEAAVAYQAVGTSQLGAGAITVAWPTHQAGDIGLLVIETANEAVTLGTNAANWTQVTSSPQATGAAAVAGGTRLTVYWSRATSSAMGSVGINDSGNHQIAQIITFRGGIETGIPIDVTAGAVLATAASAVSIPGATTTVANALVVAIVGYDTDTTTAQASAWANASLASITERMDVATTQGVGGGFAAATGIKATAGAYNATTATLATASVQGRISLALKPDITAPTVSSISVQSGLTVNVTFSEVMGNGVTTAANYTVSGTGKGTLADSPNSVALVSGSTYRLTWTSGEMLNAGDITITVANAQDAAGISVGTPNSGTHTAGAIGIAPTLTAVHIASNNADTTKAVTGDIITLSFTSSESITTPTVTIAGNTAAVTGGPTSWSAAYTVLAGDAVGTVAFAISSINDLVGNPGSAVTAVTDASSVTILESNSTVTVTMDGTGEGDINSTSTPTSADGILCPGDCTGIYPAGTELTLMATAASNSDFAGWTGGGCGTAATCIFNPTGTMEIFATFNQKQRVMMPGPVYYASIQAAYTACTAGTVLKLRNETFTENLDFALAMDVTLDGGYDSNWIPVVDGMTGVIGSVTITAGSVTVSGLSII